MTEGRRTRHTTFAYEYPIKTDRKRIKEKDGNWGCGRGRQGGFVRQTLGRLRTKKGEEKRMGSIVHRVGVQALHRLRMPLRVQGEGMDRWTVDDERKPGE
jgi:hypothetical protein